MEHMKQLEICKKDHERFEKHLKESDEKGGYRERVLTLEIEVKVLKRGVLKNAILGGLIGALIGNASGPALSTLIKWITKTG